MSDSPAPAPTGAPAGRRTARSALGAGYARAVRGFERHAWLFDALFKAGPLVFIAVLTYPISQTEGAFFAGQESTPWPFRFGLELLAILPLAFSRIRPGMAAGIIAFSCLCQLISGLGPGISAFCAPLVVYACAKYGSRRVSLGYLGVALFGSGLLGLFVLVMPFLRFSQFAPDLVWALFMMLLFTGFAAAVVLVAWLFGDMAGRRRRELAAITERNELLERERDHEARLAVDAERMRIAREMHDVVSHSMSVMIAQSDGGRYVVEQDPRRAAQAFETIGETGREALTELRRMLGVLREEDDAQRRPTPGLQELPRLLQDVRSSGLAVQAQVVGPEFVPDGRESVQSASVTSPYARGPAAGAADVGQDAAAGSTGRSEGRSDEFAAAVSGLPSLPEGVGLAAYRIVQEALTNTLKHAGGEANAMVRIGVVAEQVPRNADAVPSRTLLVEVRDTGLGSRAAGDGAGSGLLGMQERARLYGGTVQTRAHGKGFDVVARFPLDADAVLDSAPEVPARSSVQESTALGTGSGGVSDTGEASGRTAEEHGRGKGHR